jgi:hypothetical protein
VTRADGEAISAEFVAILAQSGWLNTQRRVEAMLTAWNNSVTLTVMEFEAAVLEFLGLS